MEGLRDAVSCLSTAIGCRLGFLRRQQQQQEQERTIGQCFDLATATRTFYLVCAEYRYRIQQCNFFASILIVPAIATANKMRNCRLYWLQIIISGWLCVVPIRAINPAENEIDHPQARSHPNPKLPASEMPLEIDILKLINVSYKDQGVSPVEGPIQKYPAYKFRLPYGNVPLGNSSVITQAMNTTRGFTAVFLYRQQKNNMGTLLSVNSPGRLTPWFQLASNSKTGILTLKYRLQHSNKLNQIEWALPRHHRKSPLAAWIWLSVSMDFQDDLVRLDLDCLPSAFEAVPPKKGAVDVPLDALVYFAQEPGRKKKFLGSMQVAKVLPYVTHERLWNCVEISSNLSPEYRKPVL